MAVLIGKSHLTQTVLTMIKLKFGILLAMLAVTTTAFAGYSPANVQAALKKMYPDAKNIAWSQDDGYYCADFMMNGI